MANENFLERIKKYIPTTEEWQKRLSEKQLEERQASDDRNYLDPIPRDLPKKQGKQSS